MDSLLQAMATISFLLSLLGVYLSYRPLPLHRIAVHEVGHALMVLTSVGVTPSLKLISAVPQRGSEGHILYSFEAETPKQLREHIVVYMGGAAGEYYARGNIEKNGCSQDLKYAAMFAEMARAGGYEGVEGKAELDIANILPNEVEYETKVILQECFNEALARINRERAFFELLTRWVIDHRELTLSKAARLLKEHHETAGARIN